MKMSSTENYSSWGAGKGPLTAYATLIGMGGLLGNGLVIFLFIYFKCLRTVTNNFIINLAACDLMIAMLDLVFSMPTLYASEWLFGRHLATFYAFAHVYLVSVSMVMLAIIAVDRYYVIIRTKPRARISARKSLVIIAGVYAYTFSIASPILYAPAVLDVKIYQSGCYVDFATASDFGSGSYAVVVATFLYVAPLIIIVFYYWEIFKVLRKRRDRSSLAEAENNRRRYDLCRAELGNRNSGTHSRRVQTRTLRVMATLVGLFVVTWTPYMIVNLARVFGQREYFNDLVQEICIQLAKLVVVANPIAYALVNHRFQKCIAKLFYCTDVMMGGTTTENSIDNHIHSRGSRTPTFDPRSPRFSRQRIVIESSTVEVSTPNIQIPSHFAFNENRTVNLVRKTEPNVGEREGTVVDTRGSSQEDTRGSDKDKRGSDKEKRGSDDEKKGLDQNNMGSDEDKMGSDEDKRGSDEDKRGSDEDKRGSEEDKRGSEEDKRGSEEDKRGSEVDKRGSEEVKNGTGHTKGSEETRGTKCNSYRKSFKRLRFDSLVAVDKTEWYITVTTF